MRKYSLKELEHLLPVLDENEQKAIMGGGNDSLRISGGTLYNQSDGVLYQGDNGESCFFRGVTFVTPGFVPAYTSAQYGGYIFIDKEWANNGYSVNTFMHEYGHYIQQSLYGCMSGFQYTYTLYNWYVAVPSAWDLIKRYFYDPGYSHDSLPCEQEATKYGQNYYNANKYYTH